MKSVLIGCSKYNIFHIGIILKIILPLLLNIWNVIIYICCNGVNNFDTFPGKQSLHWRYQHSIMAFTCGWMWMGRTCLLGFKQHKKRMHGSDWFQWGKCQVHYHLLPILKKWHWNICESLSTQRISSYGDTHFWNTQPWLTVFLEPWGRIIIVS